GAGTIIRDTEGVHGLTTAASLWVVAAIGLAVGCGFWKAACFVTALALVVLFILRYAEGMIFHSKEESRD
ncbi:MAG: MgtC/SapB family protein, partial [Candidatus Omnitrophica bacterium]|nr:MgtC/SapB family protein [Candidatus Omnitrophota bacterium]